MVNLENKTDEINLKLLKSHNEVYIFKCTKGDESKLLETFFYYALDPELSFNEADAAILYHALRIYQNSKTF